MNHILNVCSLLIKKLRAADKLVFVKKYFIKFSIFVATLLVISNIINQLKTVDIDRKLLSKSYISAFKNNQHLMQRNKPILIHFWATWCPICSVESSNIESISNHYDVLTVAVKSGNWTELEEYTKKRDLSFKIINDENGDIATQFNISIFPTTIIFDKDAKVIFYEVGYTSNLGLMFRMWYAENFANLF